MPGEFHFLRPWWLLAFVPLLVFLIWFARRRFEIRRWREIVDPALMPHVLIGAGDQSRWRITTILAVAGVLMISALAGPTWERLPQPVFRSQDALVIALDLSRSMDVADVKPSRLARARFEISDILERRDEGQTALIVFAAEPFIISPLTDDTRTIVSQLPALTTDLMPSQGSRADRALEMAADLLSQAGAGEGHVLLVTDGADAKQTQATARQLGERQIRVSVLGIGTADGGPIPGQDGFVKRSDGSIVIARIDATGLRSIADAGAGSYASLAVDESDIDRLLAGMDESPGEAEASGLEADVWREQGPWLLLPLLPLAALAFRRGIIAVLLLALVLPVRPATAMDWDDLWSRPDQRANRVLESGDAVAATDLFVDQAWKGAAAYRAGRFEDSVSVLDGLDDVDATYNRGNALARLGRYEEAIRAYEDVLENDADHVDARYNRDLLRELQQQSQQDDGESPESGDGSPEDDQSGGQQSAESQDDGSGQQGQSAAADQSGQSAPPSDPAPESRAGEQTGEADDQESGVDEGGGSMADAGDENVTQADGADQQAAASAQQAQDASDDAPADESTAMAMSDDQPSDEDAQATEQWLRKIPDDPGGLLRRKFYYQYQQRRGAEPEEEPW